MHRQCKKTRKEAKKYKILKVEMLFCLEPLFLNSEQVNYYNEWLVLNKLVPPNPLYLYISATHTHTHKTLTIPFKIASNHQIPRGKKPNEMCAGLLHKEL